MDMTPYTGRVRLTCFRDICAAGKARIDAECVICSECRPAIIDLNDMTLREWEPLQAIPEPALSPTEMQWSDNSTEPKAAVTPRPDSVGAGLKPARKKED